MNTWKDKKNIMLILLASLCIAVIGCNSLLDGVTPAKRSFLAAKYLCDPNSAGFTTLGKLKEDRTRIFIKYRDTQTTLLREAEDNSAGYKDAKDFIDLDIAESQNFRDTVIGSPSEPFSILGVLAAAGLAGAWGRATKRKGDRDENEVEAEVAKRMNGADRG